MNKCDEHGEMIRELAKAGAHIEMIKEQVSEAATKVTGLAEKVERLVGRLEPALIGIDNLVAHQRNTSETVSKIKLETKTVQEDLQTYKDEHKNTHNVLRWAVTAVSGGVLLTMVMIFAKAFGLL